MLKRGADLGSYTELRSHRLPSADRGKVDIVSSRQPEQRRWRKPKTAPAGLRETSVHPGGEDSGSVCFI